MQRTAFSLVELSIVLVILGLLTGGILAGQSLIRASELRAVSTEYNRYMSATQTFRDKYFALPGDMTNATQFWGAAAAPASCLGTPSTDIKTCDGDGNGIVNTMSATFTSMEMYRYWQHLANAGLIEGSYNGVGDSPKSKLSPSPNWFMIGDGLSSGAINQFDDLKPGNSFTHET